MEAKDQINAIIADLGLEYSATFVPFSKSRNAKPVKTTGDLSLNWKVKFSRKGYGQSIETDYSQGIGHLPGYKYSERLTVDEFARIKRAAETGQNAYDGSVVAIGRPVPAPQAYDVLFALAQDATVLNYRNYEEWAADVGFDPDSRKGEATYQACIKIALELRALIGDAAIQKIAEAEL